jgi:hypothetical protein
MTSAGKTQCLAVPEGIAGSVMLLQASVRNGKTVQFSI